MSISKISRRIVVAFFIAIMILIFGMETYYAFNSIDTLNNNMFSKFIYVILLITLFTTYATIKSRFSRRRLKKRISLMYRFIFLIMSVLGIKLCILVNSTQNLSNKRLFLISFIMVISSLVLKKIIYNVSKSDMLSVLGLYMYALFPNIIKEPILLTKMSLTVFNILLVIMFFQRLIDELKQLNLKTKKYIKLSIILGIFIGITMMFNINSLIYIFTAIGLLFIVENLDTTHINYSKKMFNRLDSKKKDLIYKLELIHINKIVLAIIIIIFVAYISYMLSIYCIKLINIDKISEIFIPLKSNNILFNILRFKNLNFNDIKVNFMNIISCSRGYYIIIIGYILLIEFITIFLRRRYDTKSTTLKMFFVFMFLINILFSCEFEIFFNVYTIFLILISITNTSNIYLNRDERIKLLN